MTVFLLAWVFWNHYLPCFVVMPFGYVRESDEMFLGDRAEALAMKSMDCTVTPILPQ